MTDKGLRIEVPVDFKRDQQERKLPAKGQGRRAQEPAPRMARLLALAWKWELAVRQGQPTTRSLPGSMASPRLG